jgi:hypothetical protein
MLPTKNNFVIFFEFTVFLKKISVVHSKQVLIFYQTQNLCLLADFLFNKSLLKHKLAKSIKLVLTSLVELNFYSSIWSVKRENTFVGHFILTMWTFLNFYFFKLKHFKTNRDTYKGYLRNEKFILNKFYPRRIR